MNKQNKQSSRRQFLRFLGASSGALLLSGLGCGSAAESNQTESDNTGPDTNADPNPNSEAGSCDLTGSDVRGPFHVEGAPERTILASEDEPGQRLLIEGTVYGPDCTSPVAGAVLDVWQADADGEYHGAGQDYRLRGQMMTDSEGKYRFETIRPGHYPLGGSTRPAHIHLTITRPGYSPLTTQLYFQGDPYLAPNDPCGSTCNSGDETLIIELEEADNGALRGTFDIVLTSTG